MAEVLVEFKTIGEERVKRTRKALEDTGRLAVRVNQDIATSTDRKAVPAFISMAKSLNSARQASKNTEASLRNLRVSTNRVSKAYSDFQGRVNSIATALKRETDAAETNEQSSRALLKAKSNLSASEAAYRAEVNAVSRELKENAKQQQFATSSKIKAKQAITNLESQMDKARLTMADLNKRSKAVGVNFGEVTRSGKAYERAMEEIKKELRENIKAAKTNADVTNALANAKAKAAERERMFGRTVGNAKLQLKDYETRQKATQKELGPFAQRFDNLARSVRGLEGPLGGTAARLQTFSAVINSGQLKAVALTSAIVGLTAAFGGLSFAIIRNEEQFQKVENTLAAATGSINASANSMAFVKEQAIELGLNLQSTAQQFASLQAAARGTSLAGREAEEIFEGIVTAGRAMGLTAQDIGGALRAVQQSISKGTVQAEELRGQLGERLPGAFQIAAESMGVTTAELNKMLEQGEVLASDLWPDFADVLQNRFSGAARQAAKDIAGVNQRLGTEVQLLLRNIDKLSGISDAYTAAVTSVNEFLRSVNESNESIRTAIALFDALVAGIATAVGLLVAKGAIAAFRSLATSIYSVRTAMNALTAATIAFQSVSIIGLISTAAAGVAFLISRMEESSDVIEENEEFLSKYGEALDSSSEKAKDFGASLKTIGDEMERQIKLERESINTKIADTMAEIEDARQQVLENRHRSTSTFTLSTGPVDDKNLREQEKYLDRLEEQLERLRGIKSDLETLSEIPLVPTEPHRFPLPRQLPKIVADLREELEGLRSSTANVERVNKAIRNGTISARNAEHALDALASGFRFSSKGVQTYIEEQRNLNESQQEFNALVSVTEERLDRLTSLAEKERKLGIDVTDLGPALNIGEIRQSAKAYREVAQAVDNNVIAANQMQPALEAVQQGAEIGSEAFWAYMEAVRQSEKAEKEFNATADVTADRLEELQRLGQQEANLGINSQDLGPALNIGELREQAEAYEQVNKALENNVISSEQADSALEAIIRGARVGSNAFNAYVQAARDAAMAEKEFSENVNQAANNLKRLNEELGAPTELSANAETQAYFQKEQARMGMRRDAIERTSELIVGQRSEEEALRQEREKLLDLEEDLRAAGVYDPEKYEAVTEAIEENTRALGMHMQGLDGLAEGAGQAFTDYARSARTAAEVGYDALTGSIQSFEDALADSLRTGEDLLENFKNAFLDMAAEIAAQEITTTITATVASEGAEVLASAGGSLIDDAIGFVGDLFFADGGRPRVGKTAIVGEEGPEAFVPDTAGTIIPNDEMANWLGSQGRGGDSMVAHINPREAALLKSLGGSGTINPVTGLREFIVGGMAGQMGAAEDAAAAAESAGEASNTVTGFGQHAPTPSGPGTAGKMNPALEATTDIAADMGSPAAQGGEQSLSGFSNLGHAPHVQSLESQMTMAGMDPNNPIDVALATLGSRAGFTPDPANASQVAVAGSMLGMTPMSGLAMTMQGLQTGNIGQVAGGIAGGGLMGAALSEGLSNTSIGGLGGTSTGAPEGGGQGEVQTAKEIAMQNPLSTASVAGSGGIGALSAILAFYGLSEEEVAEVSNKIEESLREAYALPDDRIDSILSATRTKLEEEFTILSDDGVSTIVSNAETSIMENFPVLGDRIVDSVIPRFERRLTRLKPTIDEAADNAIETAEEKLQRLSKVMEFRIGRTTERLTEAIENIAFFDFSNVDDLQKIFKLSQEQIGNIEQANMEFSQAVDENFIPSVDDITRQMEVGGKNLRFVESSFEGLINAVNNSEDPIEEARKVQDALSAAYASGKINAEQFEQGTSSLVSLYEQGARAAEAQAEALREGMVSVETAIDSNFIPSIDTMLARADLSSGGVDSVSSSLEALRASSMDTSATADQLRAVEDSLATALSNNNITADQYNTVLDQAIDLYKEGQKEVDGLAQDSAELAQAQASALRSVSSALDDDFIPSVDTLLNSIGLMDASSSTTSAFSALLEDLNTVISGDSDTIGESSLTNVFDALNQSLESGRINTQTYNSAIQEAIQVYNRAEDATRGLADAEQERVNAQERAGSALQSIDDFLTDFVTSDVSPLTPQQQLARVEDEFTKVAQEAAAGDITAVERFPDVADAFLEQSREVSGTGVGFAEATNKVLDAAEQLSSISQDELVASTIENETRTQTEELSAVLNEINNTLLEIRQQQEAPTRDIR